MIARLRNGSYELDERAVRSPKHGFCRDCEFKVVAQSETSIAFRTVDDNVTREVFPFSFSLEVEYSIKGPMLSKAHRIANTGDAPLPFEVGGHEGYAIDAFRDGWHVQFFDIDSIDAYGMDTEGILALPKWELSLPGGRLDKTPKELGIDTIIMENVPRSRIMLAENNGPRSVEIEFDDFPYLGIWTKAGVKKLGS